MKMSEYMLALALIGAGTIIAVTYIEAHRKEA